MKLENTVQFIVGIAKRREEIENAEQASLGGLRRPDDALRPVGPRRLGGPRRLAEDLQELQQDLASELRKLPGSPVVAVSVWGACLMF